MAVLKNKTGMYKAISILKCVMLLTLTCRNLSTDVSAVSWLLHRLSFPRFSESLKMSKISKRLGARTVVVDYSNNFLLTLQDILNPDFSLTFRKMQLIK